MVRFELKMVDLNVGSITVNFDLGDELTFEMLEILKWFELELVELIWSVFLFIFKFIVVYDVEELMECRYGSRVEIVTIYDIEVEDESSEDGE